MSADPADPRWASSGTYVTTPASGQQDDGWVPGQRAPAQLLNWLFVTIRAWIIAIKVWAGYGLMRWQERIEIEEDLTHPDASFAVAAGGVYIAKTAGGFGSFNPFGGGTVLGLADVEGSPSALSPASWYYVYAYLDGSNALAYQISATGPTLGLFKDGAENTHLYMGSFKTDTTAGVPGFGLSIGFPLPQIRSGRWVHYRVTGSNRTYFEVDHQTSPAPGTAKLIDCNALITPGKGARVAKVNIISVETGGNTVALYVNGLGGRVALWLGPNTRASTEMIIDLDAFGRFTLHASDTTIEWWVVFLGFEERN